MINEVAKFPIPHPVGDSVPRVDAREKVLGLSFVRR